MSIRRISALLGAFAAALCLTGCGNNLESNIRASDERPFHPKNHVDYSKIAPELDEATEYESQQEEYKE